MEYKIYMYVLKYTSEKRIANNICHTYCEAILMNRLTVVESLAENENRDFNTTH